MAGERRGRPAVSLTFAQPWLLLALLLLPLIWWLIRRLPPTPRLAQFPGVRLLLGLDSRTRKPSGAPLWLRLLRLAAALLAIVGLAEPRFASAPRIGGDGPLLLLIDGGWASAPNWETRRRLAEDLLTAASRDQTPARVAVLSNPPERLDLAPPASLMEAVANLAPAPWPPDRDAWADEVMRVAGDSGAVHWIHDGLAHGGEGLLERALEGTGATVHLTRPPRRTLGAPARSPDGATISLLRSLAGPAETVSVLARDRDGRALARGEAAIAAGERVAETRIRLAPPLANRVASFHVEGEQTAAAVRLVGGAWRRPRVGILSLASADQPLLDGTHYVQAALAPFADIVTGDAGTLLARAPHSIVALDSLPADAVAGIDSWVRSGGQLVRFAGPDMAASGGEEPLLPVRVLSGGRDLGGAMSWSRPQAVALYAETGPLAGLSPSPEARVMRQLLAAPSPQTSERTWARLEDGTPIITAAELGRGEVVLVHTTADTRWSTLPLTGDFARILGRVTRRTEGLAAGEGPWRLEMAVSAGGGLSAPANRMEPVPEAQMARGQASSALPPGLYASESATRVVAVETDLLPSAPPADAQVQALEAAHAIHPAPWLLALAVLLVALDIAVSARRHPMAGAAAAGLAAVLAIAPFDARTQEELRELPAGALETTFAYILTGDRRLDDMSEAGLYGLGNVLYRRTSILAAPPAGVDPAVDDLSVYPMLYWPIRSEQPAPPDAAVAELNRFLATGGMLILDTGDQGIGVSSAGLARRNLARLVGRLNMPPLAVAGSEHVLTRSFYLINEFPGRWSGGRIWVAAGQEDGGGAVNDGVTPVILGGSDWAAAWAEDSSGRPLAALESASERQREMARRAGINFAMHALTGNYKHDQVHQPAIIERLQN